MLEIRGLRVSIEEREIIKGLDLEVKDGEIHAIMGPNGAGKSSLAQALMGHPNYSVKGSIKIDGEELVGKGADERARAGLFLAFQQPQAIEGVKLAQFIRKARASLEGKEELEVEEMLKIQHQLEDYVEQVGLTKEFLKRDINLGFSGGEKKRAEILQMMALKPKVIILDEVDSGLDVDGIRQVANAVLSMKDGKRCFLVITHYPRILKYIRPDRVHILAGGRIVKSGEEALAHEIEEKGYEEVLRS